MKARGRPDIAVTVGARLIVLRPNPLDCPIRVSNAIKIFCNRALRVRLAAPSMEGAGVCEDKNRGPASAVGMLTQRVKVTSGIAPPPRA